MTKNIKLKIYTVVVFILIIPIFIKTASASYSNIDSYLDTSKKQEIYSSLDEDAKELLQELGITDIEINEIFNVGFNRVLGSFFDLLSGSLKDKAFTFMSILACMLIVAIVNSISGSEKKKGSELIGYSILSLVIGVPFISFLSVVKSLFSSVLGFMKAFIPIYAAVIAVSGKPTLALSFSTAVLAFGEFIVYFVDNLYSPFMGMIFCLALVGGISDIFDCENIISAIKKGVTFILGLAATLFSGLLSIKSVLASATDSVGAKGIKFLIGAGVPVVGSSINEALSSIAAGLSLLKSTVGVFGIIALFAIFFPVLIEVIAWIILLQLSAVLAKALGCEKEQALLKNVSLCASLILAAAAIMITVLIVSCGIILKLV
ncbi:MAG TPA: hypothetical protein VFC76_07495 [Oscillospiraceae bacterium]|nr:hypothetical protein [Oscillospiraceae bacterium]